MESPDDLAAALPAPRQDEPPDLRRKIIAELRDHLHAAMQRELLLTGTAEQAQRKVLSRFGDPARIARKLWYDAMWEKIMSQRMVLAALVLVVLVSVGSTGLTWFLVVQAGQVNQALLEQNRAANELMLAKLTALGNAAGNSGKSMEWNSLKVRLSLEKPGGAPAVGLQVQLNGHLFDPGSNAELARTTGPDGIADFGLVRPGQHGVMVESSWGYLLNNQMGSYSELVTVLPGEPQTVEIVCPGKPEEAEIAIAVDWPDELAKQPLWLVCGLIRSPRNLGDHSWAQPGDGTQYIAIEPSGKQLSLDTRFQFFRDGEQFYADSELVMSSYVEDSRSDANSPGIYRYRNDGDSDEAGWLVPRTEEAMPPHLWLPKTATVSRLKCPVGTYSVTHIAVGIESTTEEEHLPDDMRHPVFLGGIAISDSNGAVQLLYPGQQQASSRRRNRKRGKFEVPRFEAVAGRPNEWRLSLPQPLVDLLNEPQPRIKPTTDADGPVSSRVPNYSAYGAPPNGRARPTQPQAVDDNPNDEDEQPPRSRTPRATPEEDADGPFDHDDAPRPRRKLRVDPEEVPNDTQ